jgi:hypothetical protein
MKLQAALLFVIGAGLASPQAQQPADVIFRREVKAVPGPEGPDVFMYKQQAGPGPFTVDFIGAEMSFGDETVKGAPYAAEAVTETTQTLSDGNRITRKSTASVFRDSEGRTRREESLGAIGPWASAGDPPRHIFINDPVAGTSYILDPQNHTASKLMTKVMMAGAPAAGARVFAFRHELPHPPGVAEGKTIEAGVSGTFEAAIPKGAGPDVKTESLGKQSIEGVQAEGTRSTITIAAGAIGNERAIESVSERWYSTELHTVVMTKRSDPRFGDTVYRLINIRRGEQPPTLFEVPSDYTIKDPDTIKQEFLRTRKKAEESK